MSFVKLINVFFLYLFSVRSLYLVASVCPCKTNPRRQQERQDAELEPFRDMLYIDFLYFFRLFLISMFSFNINYYS